MDWMNLIGNLFFPVFACVALGWFIKYSTDKNREDMKDLRKEHEEEVKLLSDAVNNNTLVLQKIVDRLDSLDRKEERYE